jgi:hypothetical protein
LLNKQPFEVWHLKERCVVQENVEFPRDYHKVATIHTSSFMDALERTKRADFGKFQHGRDSRDVEIYAAHRKTRGYDVVVDPRHDVAYILRLNDVIKIERGRAQRLDLDRPQLDIGR